MSASASQILILGYGQLAVFDGAVQKPFNDWTPQHIAQGFSYRNGAVSFKTISDTGRIKVEIRESEGPDSIEPTTRRAYLMPLDVTGGRGIEIATVETEAGAFRWTAPNGYYALTIQLGQEAEGRDWCIVSVRQSESWPLEAKLLVRDDEITIEGGFLMTAEPA